MLALTLPDTFRLRLNFTSGFILDILHGWDQLMALPVEEKLRQLRDPDIRAEWDRLAQSTEGTTRAIGNWAGYWILETFSDEWKPYQGRLIGDIAREIGRSPWDTLADIVIADNLRTVIANQDRGQDDATWQRRVEVWRDPRAIVGASDAGAHLDMIDSFSYCTTMLARAVRERDMMPLEEAVHHLTARPASLYGLIDRGQLTPGYLADITIIDPAYQSGAGGMEYPTIFTAGTRFEELKVAVNMVPQIEAEFTQLNRDYDITKSNYEKLLSRREQAQISGDMETNASVIDFRVIDPPTVPSKPAAPNRPMLMSMVLLGALGGGIAIAFLLSQLRPTFHDQRRLRQVSGLPVFGTVVLVWSAAQKSKWRRGLIGFVVTLISLLSAYAAIMGALVLTASRA